MPRSSPRTRLALHAALAPLFVAVAVAAPLARGAETPSAAQCSAAYESAQLLRRDAKLVAAREAAASCARASCPDVVRQDCSTWAGELQRLVPSVIVIARDEATGDERGARVIIDGVERVEAATGRAFELDPGAHALRIERAGDRPLEETLTVVQGERDRVLRFVLRGLVVSALPRDATPARERSYLPAALVGGAAALALGASAWLGVSGRSDLSALRSSCAPTCADDQVNPVRRKLIVSDVLLGVGVVAAAVSVYLVLRPPTSGAPEVARLALTANASRDGARVTFAATF